MSIPENLRCPKCGSGDLAEIVYGPVEMTEDLLLKVQAKKVLIRNEPVPENPPRYYCFHCGYEW
ncbi:MAG: hypothetical protein ACYSOF_04255 [Planctomycetota bacterium]|jgi:ribosomal protein S27AE